MSRPQPPIQLDEPMDRVIIQQDDFGRRLKLQRFIQFNDSWLGKYAVSKTDDVRSRHYAHGPWQEVLRSLVQMAKE